MALLREAGFSEDLPTEGDLKLLKRFQHLLHIDSVSRLRLYLGQIEQSTFELDDLPILQKRAIQMLTFRLLQASAREQDADWAGGVKLLHESPMARTEFEELVLSLLDRVRMHSDEHPLLTDCPLFLHRRYTRDEILVGLGLPGMVGARHTQTGRFWIEPLNTELLFVTLDKSDKSFSPTTRYEDFAASPTRFHWQSQSTTGENSPTGRRYVAQSENGCTILLFVRPTNNDAFVFLGPVRYLSHSGSRPMSIYWDLVHPMPVWFFEICASLRVA